MPSSNMSTKFAEHGSAQAEGKYRAAAEQNGIGGKASE